MRADRVATPVLEVAAAQDGRRGTVLGLTEGATYLELGGFVVALSARGIPLLPNAVTVGAPPRRGRWGRPGAEVVLRLGRIEARGAPAVTWEAARPPAWEPRLAPLAAHRAPAASARGAAVLGALGIDPEYAPDRLACAVPSPDLASADLARAGDGGVLLLMRALAERDPELAARAAARLVGLGPGLTPEGDDLLAGTAAAVSTLAPTAWPRSVVEAWLAALLPPDLACRTTALSATLLELATRGCAPEPVHRLLDLDTTAEAPWRTSLRELLRLGHSTGRAWAAQVAAAAVLINSYAAAATARPGAAEAASTPARSSSSPR